MQNSGCQANDMLWLTKPLTCYANGHTIEFIHWEWECPNKYYTSVQYQGDTFSGQHIEWDLQLMCLE